MIKLNITVLALASAPLIAAAQAPAAAPSAHAGRPAQRLVTPLKCFVEGSAAPLKLGREAGPDLLLRQRIMVQNTGRAALLNGQIDFTVGLANGAGLEKPVANVPRAIGPGEILQVGLAYRATECSATFTQTVGAS